jgi:hypothetical protein
MNELSVLPYINHEGGNPISSQLFDRGLDVILTSYVISMRGITSSHAVIGYLEKFRRLVLWESDKSCCIADPSADYVHEITVVFG